MAHVSAYCTYMYIKKLCNFRSPSLVNTQEMMVPPPYEYPHHLTNVPTMPDSELTIEPAASSTVL